MNTQMQIQSQILNRLDRHESADRYRVSGDPRVQRHAAHYRNRLAMEIATYELEQLAELPVNVRRAKISSWIDDMVDDEQRLFTDDEYGEIVDIVQAEMVGLGPIQPLLQDDSISEIMVNWIKETPDDAQGRSLIYVERFGRIEEAPRQIQFRDQAHLLHVIDRIVSPIGRRIDESIPYVDARLPSGHRVNAVIPPLAVDGPILTIRKFRAQPFTSNDLLHAETMTDGMLTFLKACARAKLNILISGGTGAGKTTTLNVLASYIPFDQRIITIEDAAELRFHDVHPHVLRLEARKPNVEGSGEVTIRDLIRNALRMRPDRVIVGECRGAEALDMLQAMNTGQEGSMTTVHANSTRDAFLRLENMVLSAEAGRQLSLKPIREQLASAIDIVIQQTRLRGGKRKIVSISEVQGLRHDKIVLKDIFHFHQTGVDERGHAVGHFAPTGVVPTCLPRLRSRLTERESGLLEGIFSLEYFSRELGPHIMQDHNISEIVINSPDDIYIERGGAMERLTSADLRAAGGIGFVDAHAINEIVLKIGARMGRRIDQDTPMLDARLPDGSRVNVIMPPLVVGDRDDETPTSPAVTIRRFPSYFSLQAWIDHGAMSDPMAAYLAACIQARYNVLVLGGTGSGKTTLLNALCESIPEAQRVVTVEEVAELNLKQEHWVRLETRPADQFDERQVTIRDLVKNCLRMRPDRIIVGECRGAEALDMLQAMNTGHAGSMTTIHANSPTEAFTRLGTMTRMATEARLLESREVDAQMNVIDLVVHTERLHDGTRKIVNVAEVLDGLEIRPIFRFDTTGHDQTSARRFAHGVYRAVNPPHDMDRLQLHVPSLTPDRFHDVCVTGEQLHNDA